MKLKSLDTTHPNICINQCSFGKGVFAKNNISQGDIILTFSGRIITLEEASKKGEKESNALQIGSTEYIDLEEPGVLVNHSCNPNAGILNNRVLVALTEIYKDEEILYDYSTTMSENLWTMNCECLSSNCRKIIKDFHYLPTKVKEKYLELGIVQTFIVQEHNEKVKGGYILR